MALLGLTIGISLALKPRSRPQLRRVDLMIVPMGDNLLCVTWNRSLPGMTDASGAALHISDGGHAREVLLDRDQLANGFLTYKPASDDVTFKLEVRAGTREAGVGSIRFLAGASPMPASSPPPEAVSAHRDIPPVVVISNERQRRTNDEGEQESAAGISDRQLVRDGMAIFIVKTQGTHITIWRADTADSAGRPVTSESLRLPAGKWIYRASAPGFETESGRFLVNAAPAEIFIRLRPKQMTSAGVHATTSPGPLQ